MSKLVSKTSPLLIIISASDADAKGERADRVLTRLAAFPSRSQLKIWFAEGRIMRDGIALQPASKLKPDDRLLVDLRPEENLKVDPVEMKLDIQYEDEHLLVLYKPRGLSMHPGAGRGQTTLAHGLVHHSKSLSSRSGEFRPGIVHRLDKDTEGLVVIAKSNAVHENLSEQFSSRKILRRYWALCWGHPPEKLRIEGSIGRSESNRKKMAVVRTGGKPAITEVTTLKHFPAGYSWVECKLLTGRTHQIRVHLSSKGFPLLGDPLYGKAGRKEISETLASHLKELKGQALVAFELGFTHPVSGKDLYFKAKAPEWLRALTIA